MSRWYRAYEGTVTDAKLGEAALMAECSRSVAIAAWHCILESCASAQRGGEFDTTPRRVAVILAEPVAVIDALFSAFIELGMIGNGTVTAWKHRQYESDTSTERSRKHRERKRSGSATDGNGDATLQQRDATPPETDTETETEREKGARAQDVPSHSGKVGEFLTKRAADLTEWEHQFLISIRWEPSLTKAQAEKLEAITAKLEAKDAGAAVGSMFWVSRGTPAYDAWVAYYRRFSKTGRTFHESRDTFTVPTEFPPAEEKAA